MPKIKRSIAVILLIAVSFGIAFGVDALWRLIERGMHPDDFREIVDKYAAEYNVPAYVIFAVIDTESDFEPGAVSSAGAQGLMQMMPSTFEWLTSSDHLDENLSPNDIFEPEVSIRYGTYYLRYLFEKFYNYIHQQMPQVVLDLCFLNFLHLLQQGILFSFYYLLSQEIYSKYHDYRAL